MLTDCKTRTSRLISAAWFAVAALLLFSGSAFAQSDSNPKWDWFIGYQWAHPGITLPTGNPVSPTPYTVPDMPRGFGTALAYNFDPHFALEADFGFNTGNSNSLTTASIGPRLMFRTEDANFFVHAMMGGNWLSVSGSNNGLADHKTILLPSVRSRLGLGKAQLCQ